MDKDRYRQLCEHEPVPLFLQHWWLEAVCAGKRWDVVAAYDRQGNPTAVMPFLWGSRFGIRYVLQPQLTQFSGPYFFYPEGLDPRRRLAFEHEASRQLLQRLETFRVAYFNQNFSPSVTNWLPFYWAGFAQTTRYTYRLPSLGDLDAVWAAMDGNQRRRQVRQNLGRYTLGPATPDELATLHRQYWEARAGHDLLSRDLMTRVASAALARGQALLLGLRDGEGQLCAVHFAPYDDRCAYSLLSAQRPGGQDRGVASLLVWLMLRELSSRTQAFDFEGSMDPDIERYYRSYGAEQISYFQLTKSRSRLLSALFERKHRRS